jgi:hypothetical protein
MDPNSIAKKNQNKNDSRTFDQDSTESKNNTLQQSKILDYYDTHDIGDFSLANGSVNARAFGGKSKGGKGRNKHEVRAANSGKTCYSAKHVRILTNKHRNSK